METKIIKTIVSDSTGIDLNDKTKNSRRIQENVFARMIYFNLCREYTRLSLSDIGKSISPKKDHATVLYALRQFKDTFDFNKTFKVQYNNIRSRVQYIKNKIKDADMDFAEAIKRLETLESTNRTLMKYNVELLEEINNLNDKFKRQNKYLQQQGYNLNKNKTTNIPT